MAILKWSWLIYFSMFAYVLTTVRSTSEAVRTEGGQSSKCAGKTCDVNADCVRFDSNSSQCECRDNFVGNGSSCRDLCSTFKYNCAFATCRQSSGENGFCSCTGNSHSHGASCKFFACEWSGDRSIDCGGGSTIKIVAANYGRTEPNRCFGGSNSRCRASNSLSIVRAACQNKQKCTLSPHNRVFGDPCGGVRKYLEVDYQCDKAASYYLDATLVGLRRYVRNAGGTIQNSGSNDCSSSFGLVNQGTPIFQVFTMSKNVVVHRITLIVKAIANYIPKYHIQISRLYNMSFCGEESGYYKSYPPNRRVSVECNNFTGGFVTVIGLSSKDTIDICHIEIEGENGTFFSLGDSASGVYSLSINANRQLQPLISERSMDMLPQQLQSQTVLIPEPSLNILAWQQKCINLGAYDLGGDLTLAVPNKTMAVTKVIVTMGMASLHPLRVFVLDSRGRNRECLRNTVSSRQVFYCDNYEAGKFCGPYIYVQFPREVKALNICDIEVHGIHPSAQILKAELRRGMCLEGTFGDDTFKGRYTFKTTPGMMFSLMPCKYNENGTALRYCRLNYDNSATWDEPNLDACLPKTITTRELGELNKTTVCERDQTRECVSAVNTAMKLNKIINDSTAITTSADVKLSSNVITNIVNKTKKGDAANVTGNILVTVSNIMEANQSIIDEAETSDKSATNLLKGLDNLAVQLGESVPQGVNISTKNIGLQVKKVPRREVVVEAELVDMLSVDLPKNFTPFSMNIFASAVIPNDTFDSASEVIYSYAYRDGSLFVDTNRSEIEAVGKNLERNNTAQSVVLSVSIGNRNISSLPQPILLRFKKQHFLDRNNTCVFWEFNIGEGSGRWSSSGCRVVDETSDGRVTCACDHLTSFAILLDVYQTGSNYESLSYITWIGCGISLMGLLLTIIVHTVYSTLRKRVPSRILVCLSASFLVLLVVFLAGITRVENRVACQVVAGLLHYFLLAVFAWMAVTAINLYQLVVLVFRRNDYKFFKRAFVVAWGVPLIIVVVTGAVEPSSLGDDRYCFVQGYAFYFAVLLPILLVLVSNFIIFILILVNLSRSPPTDHESKLNHVSVKRQCRIAFSCSVLLGLTWLFAVLAVGDAEFVFQLLFCVFNSLQGFLIFVLYTLRNPIVMERLAYYCCGKGKEPTSSTVGANSKASNMTNMTSRPSSMPGTPIHGSPRPGHPMRNHAVRESPTPGSPKRGFPMRGYQQRIAGFPPPYVNRGFDSVD